MIYHPIEQGYIVRYYVIIVIYKYLSFVKELFYIVILMLSWIHYHQTRAGTIAIQLEYS